MEKDGQIVFVRELGVKVFVMSDLGGARWLLKKDPRFISFTNNSTGAGYTFDGFFFMGREKFPQCHSDHWSKRQPLETACHKQRFGKVAG